MTVEVAKQKFNLLKRYGVNFVVNIKFNKNFSKITAKKFIENIIFKKINPKLIFVSDFFQAAVSKLVFRDIQFVCY